MARIPTLFVSTKEAEYVIYNDGPIGIYEYLHEEVQVMRRLRGGGRLGGVFAWFNIPKLNY